MSGDEGSGLLAIRPLWRLASANVASYSSSAETYGYDPYGNLISYAGRSLPTDTATNRFTSASGVSPQYDAAGNLTNWTDTGSGSTYALAYTPLNQLATITASDGTINRRMAYTADGERILVRDGSSTMLTLRGLDGQVVSEMTLGSTGWSWWKDYVYRNGLLLSSVSATAGLRHYALDHLGSPRLVTNRCGERVRFLATNPFGKDPDTATQDAERMRYTIHERDIGDPSTTSDDIDTMHARSYMPFLGRFTSADLLRGNPHSPQSFNLFAYVANNPMNSTDPLGLDPPPSGNNDDFYFWEEGVDQAQWYWMFRRDRMANFTDSIQVAANAPSVDYVTVPVDQIWGPAGDDTLGSGGTRPRGPQQPRPCSVAPKKLDLNQYMGAVVSAAQMTLEFLTGSGPDNYSFGPDTVESQMMATSPGVTDAVNDYLTTGNASGGWHFGLMGLRSAGGNPIRQFVGSYTYNVTRSRGGLTVTLSNPTSFTSLTYDRGPSWERSSFGPMGTTHQTYQVFVPCKG
jgi:RHS repeat-associated protein